MWPRFPRNPPFLAQAPCRIQQKFTLRTRILKLQYSSFPRQQQAIPDLWVRRSSSLTPGSQAWGPAIRGFGMTRMWVNAVHCRKRNLKHQHANMPGQWRDSSAANNEHFLRTLRRNNAARTTGWDAFMAIAHTRKAGRAAWSGHERAASRQHKKIRVTSTAHPWRSGLVQ